VLRVTFFNPSTARPPRPWRPRDEILDAFPRIAEVLEIGAGETSGRPGGALVTELTDVGRARRRSTASRRTSAARDGAVVPEGVVVDRVIELMREPTGPPPDDWVTPAPETLARLDAHDCIVVVMMENRSYDHYFHDLPTAYPGRGYRSVPAGYTNDPPPGFDLPFRPVRRDLIGIGKNLIFEFSERSLDPNHNIDHTARQMSRGKKVPEGTRPTGEMAGFAIDFAGETDSPQIVMSYFDLVQDLPVFHVLAGQYPVCDRWFAALPVGTYPNRLAALQGNVPFLRNIKKDDPSIGYLEDYSIFDVLDRQGISWQMYESDIGTVRLYDRYRLNVANVRPIQELEVMLVGVEHGILSLPRVLFIEPAFLFGDDDHPPMGVHQGQNFLRQVLGKFLQHGQLDRTLFVITYDEHGGFFDPVSPPGTKRNRRPPGTEVAGRYVGFEGLFPQGREPRPDSGEDDLEPTSLGVRVPSLVLSPYASAKANHNILDHTAILKTILLHNRNSISTAQYGRFGERVKKRAHLGQVLDLDAPRVIDYGKLEEDIGYKRLPWQSTGEKDTIVSSRMAGLNPQHPANVLRGIGLPRPRVIRS
jgi:phospholipase C